MEEIYKRTLAKVLTKFKFEIKLKEEQQSVLFSILEKKDVFALLPTGFGKSMTYILMPLLADEVSVCSFCAARLIHYFYIESQIRESEYIQARSIRDDAPFLYFFFQIYIQII